MVPGDPSPRLGREGSLGHTAGMWTLATAIADVIGVPDSPDGVTGRHKDVRSYSMRAHARLQRIVWLAG